MDELSVISDESICGFWGNRVTLKERFDVSTSIGTPRCRDVVWLDKVANEAMSWKQNWCVCIGWFTCVAGILSAMYSYNTTLQLKIMPSNAAIEDGLCSLRNFRKTMLASGYFPGNGHWQLPGNGSSGLNFTPDYCYPKIHTSSPLSQCFAKRRWKRVLTMGDSIGRRHYLALVNVLKDNEYNCRLLRAELDKPKLDVSYYRKKLPRINLKATTRPCYTCGGRFTRCTKDESIVELEHLPLPYLTDEAISLPPEFRTTLDFYFRKYLREDTPDLIIFGPPFNHEISAPVSVTKHRLRYLIKVFERMIPTSTDFVWLPSARVFGKNAHVINSKLLTLNHALFDQLKSRFLNSSDKWNGFYDEFALSHPLKSMTVDGVHMKADYYNVLMQHLVSLFCIS
ncbi:hypothetical protein CAPTEDRAFT_198401 [Capitella teleta]|uniref:SGNH domain-containing protein n=1 Tax=Capitella teleta TaxID=283909 RepID=R7USN1_CAPTE|nr:hypothetical protein CAPTEDRAFT_198401 [Capitella teleta]|eukprot:ELU06416.1 hypothetical protein CAPTEDRAFT_198401 [Capitella teleta]